MLLKELDLRIEILASKKKSIHIRFTTITNITGDLNKNNFFNKPFTSDKFPKIYFLTIIQ